MTSVTEVDASVEFYRTYKAARVERFREYAANAAARAEAALRRSNAITDHIPFGQPILVGHHSERRHRRDLARSHAAMDRMCEENRKAKYWAARAATAESNTAIMSNNPEAITLLQGRLAVLEKQHALKLAVNKAHKAYLKKPASLDKSDLPESTKALIRSYVPQYSWEPHPYPPYSLTNGKANIRRIKERIESLKKKDALGTYTESWGDASIEVDGPGDRIRIYFPGKPDESTRTKLKSNGFRWSPREMAWQRSCNQWSKHLAESILTELGYTKETNQD